MIACKSNNGVVTPDAWMRVFHGLVCSSLRSSSACYFARIVYGGRV